MAGLIKACTEVVPSWKVSAEEPLWLPFITNPPFVLSRSEPSIAYPGSIAEKLDEIQAPRSRWVPLRGCLGSCSALRLRTGLFRP